MYNAYRTSAAIRPPPPLKKNLDTHLNTKNHGALQTINPLIFLILVNLVS